MGHILGIGLLQSPPFGHADDDGAVKARKAPPRLLVGRVAHPANQGHTCFGQIVHQVSLGNSPGSGECFSEKWGIGEKRGQ